HQTADDVVGPSDGSSVLDLQHSCQIPARDRRSDRRELRSDNDVTELPFDIMTNADRSFGREALCAGSRRHKTTSIPGDVDDPESAPPLHIESLEDVMIVDPLEQCRLDGAR